jgi:hypothetical protein
MGHTSSTVLGHIHLYQQQRERGPSGVHGETLEGVCQWADRLFTTVAEKVATIRNNKSLTEIGKRQQLAALKNTDLSFISSKRTATGTDIERYRGLLFTTPNSELEPSHAYQIEREIRDGWKEKPPHLIQAAYAKALQDDDHQVVRALTRGPLGTLVDADFQQRVQLEHAEKSQPAVFASYEQATNLMEHLSSLEGHMHSALQSLEDGA